MLSEISQTEKDIYYMLSLYVDSQKWNKLVNICSLVYILFRITKKKEAHRYGKQANGCEWGEGRKEEQDRGRGLRSTNYYV